MLRSAIKAEFGSNKAFAERARLSEGRVSQLIKGPESITAQSLEDVLRCFSDLSLQEAIYEAWVETFAPSPLYRLTRRQSEEQAHRLLKDRDQLVSAGRARQALCALEQLRIGLEDTECRFMVLRAIAETAMYLGRSTQAASAASELVEHAKRVAGPEWIARALWLLATVTRNNRISTPVQIAKAHENAADFAQSWNPPSAEARETARQIRAALDRDRALALLTINERTAVKPEHLASLITMLDRILATHMSSEARSMFLEVKGRVHLATGDLLATEDALAEVRSICGYVSYDHDTKTNILDGQFRRARGLEDHAEVTFKRALTNCYDVDDLHHAGVIEHFLSSQPPRAMGREVGRGVC